MIIDSQILLWRNTILDMSIDNYLCYSEKDTKWISNAILAFFQKIINLSKWYSFCQHRTFFCLCNISAGILFDNINVTKYTILSVLTMAHLFLNCKNKISTIQWYINDLNITDIMWYKVNWVTLSSDQGSVPFHLFCSEWYFECFTPVLFISLALRETSRNRIITTIIISRSKK